MARVRPQEQRESDLLATARLHLRGKTQREIAREIGVSVSVVNRDLSHIRRMWEAATVLTYDAAMARELARLDEIERTCWASFEASVGAVERTVTTRTSGSADGASTTIRVESVREARVGDVRWISEIQRCADRRIRLLALEGPGHADQAVDGPEAPIYLHMLHSLIFKAQNLGILDDEFRVIAADAHLVAGSGEHG